MVIRAKNDGYIKHQMHHRDYTPTSKTSWKAKDAKLATAAGAAGAATLGGALVSKDIAIQKFNRNKDKHIKALQNTIEKAKEHTKEQVKEQVKDKVQTSNPVDFIHKYAPGATATIGVIGAGLAAKHLHNLYKKRKADKLQAKKDS